MRRSEAYLPTSRAAPDHDSEAVRLAHRAGLVEQFDSGLYGFAPAGERVRQRVVARIAAEMDAVGGQRVSLPQLQYRPDWEASGRWGSFEGEMFTVENRDGQGMCLAPSHEEGVVRLVDGHVRSHEDLPLLLYQVNQKHRDDHARNGLLRTKEFTMKDAYSLHADAASLATWYDRVRAAYVRFFDAVGVDVAICTADNSVMGGSASEEFVAPVERGTGTCGLVSCTGADCRFGATDERPDWEGYAAGEKAECPDCGAALAASDGVEVGHVFRLGTRYSEAMDLTVDLPDGGETYVVMGSYGVGVTRVVQTLVQQHADAEGCRWPVTEAGTVAPWRVAIVPLQYEGDLLEAADRLYGACDDALLFDDTGQTIGERFAESDLLGIPTKVVVGNTYRETGRVEFESRDGETRTVGLDGAVEEVRRLGRA